MKYNDDYREIEENEKEEEEDDDYYFMMNLKLKEIEVIIIMEIIINIMI